MVAKHREAVSKLEADRDVAIASHKELSNQLQVAERSEFDPKSFVKQKNSKAFQHKEGIVSITDDPYGLAIPKVRYQ